MEIHQVNSKHWIEFGRSNVFIFFLDTRHVSLILSCVNYYYYYSFRLQVSLMRIENEFDVVPDEEKTLKRLQFDKCNWKFEIRIRIR